jgi:hypothetical protein
MVHWVYIVECEDNYLYVGETTRLFRRFNEHTSGRGGANTQMHKPKYLIGLYKVGENDSFMEYKSFIENEEYSYFTIRDWGIDESRNLHIENHFTEMLLYLRGRNASGDDTQPYFEYDDGDWSKVKGGKYTKHARENPIKGLSINSIMDRPLCKCSLPSEVKLSKDKKTIYFVCSLKNVWDDFDTGSLKVGSNCDFYKVYIEDEYVKKEHEINQRWLKQDWCKNLPCEFKTCIGCNKGEYIMQYAHGKRRQICQKCFSINNESLKQKYGVTKCLITDE